MSTLHNSQGKYYFNNVYQIDTCNREDNMSQSHVEHESSDIACNFG